MTKNITDERCAHSQRYQSFWVGRRTTLATRIIALVIFATLIAAGFYSLMR